MQNHYLIEIGEIGKEQNQTKFNKVPVAAKLFI